MIIIGPRDRGEPPGRPRPGGGTRPRPGAHLRRLPPGEDDLASAPVLDDWALSLRSAPCLVGRPDGHPTPGPLSVTSYLFVHAPELGWARTWSRFDLFGPPRRAELRSRGPRPRAARSRPAPGARRRSSLCWRPAPACARQPGTARG